VTESKPASGKAMKPVFLISYPKIVLLYPTFLTAIIAGIVMLVVGETSKTAEWLGVIFLWMFGVNIVVLAFDFPRTTSLTLFFLIMAVVLGLILTATSFPSFMPSVYDLLTKIRPHANATFYFCFASILAMIYLVVFVLVRFDYWEVRPNELLHHHGFMSNLERFNAPNLRITKEIDDVFEYMLFRSGRLILQPSSEPRAFVLDNVMFINRREAEITEMLGSLQVRIRTDEVPPSTTTEPL
jgi:hypothetical protein